MKIGNGRGIFVTGTDTGIGKTYVSRLLMEGFSVRHTVTCMKPVQTGCARDESGNLRAPDFEFVTQGAAVRNAGIEDHVPYRFEHACSPHLAASLAGASISLDYIREKFRRISGKKSITIVEGTGGVLTPLSETTSMIDLMLYLCLPVIVVTSPRIGTINHTLLTFEALARSGIEPVGLVINAAHPDQVPEDYIYHDTRRMLSDRLHNALLLEIGVDEGINEKIREYCDALFKRL
ncbi:MAG: dethiobiotin synthase [Chitinispirillaceae bacterium]|nr:dethiobiotin synthase [Chitinispirillaceae bacterium]